MHSAIHMHRHCPAAPPSTRAATGALAAPRVTAAAAAAKRACRRAPAPAPAPTPTTPTPHPRRRIPLPLPPAAATPDNDAAPSTNDDSTPVQERKEYYDPREMPPLPLTVARITLPELGHVVVGPSTEATRLASLAVFTEMWRDEQYGGRLNRRSAITALCMYDRDDVAAARSKPGLYPNIDVLERIYREGLDVEVVVEEK